MSLISNGAGESADANFYNGVITSSLRFNEVSDSRLDSPSFASDGGDTWTWSAWVKLCDLGTRQCLFGRAGNNAGLYFNDTVNTFKFEFNDDGAVICTAPALRRDPSAWYHVTINGNGTINKLWVNGVEQTFGSNPNLGKINEAVVHKIGFGISTTYSYDGLMADVNFVDGTALDYTAFAEFKNGILIPIEPSVTYGDNGFRLQFKGTGTSANSSGIGADTSGNDSHFTVVNLNAHDVLPDSPENNFCTLNEAANTNAAVFTEGNLVWTGNSGASRRVIGTQAVTSGKWYWEFKNTTANRMSIGIANLNFNDHHQGNDGGAFANEWVIQTDAKKLHDDNTGSPDGYGVAIGNGDLGMIAVNIDTNDIWFGREGAWFNTDGSSNTATVLGEIESGTNTNAVFTNVAGAISPVVVRKTGNNSAILNFGQDSSFAGTETAQNEADSEGFGDFYYAPPDGYLALCTVNLPEPTIGPNSDTQATDHFTTLLHTADGSAGAFTGADFQPDWIWAKNRTNNYSHELWDSNRGINSDLQSDNTNVEITDTGRLVSFDSGGFSYGTSSNLYVNNTASVAWLWKANGGTATATISESGNNPAAVVQANPTAGFSIITYTGTGANGTIAHGLGAVPEVMIFKNRTNGTSDDWVIYHGANTAAPATDHLHLNNTLNTADDDTYFNDTKPTSSVLTIGSHVGINTNDETYVAYVFAEIEGYSKFGGYVGNENSDGAFVYTGFRPAFLICKITDGGTTAYYAFFDNKRESANVKDAVLFNSNDAENTAVNDRSCDFLSNGFKLRSSAFRINGSGDNHVYFAWAETPFKYANAV